MYLAVWIALCLHKHDMCIYIQLGVDTFVNSFIMESGVIQEKSLPSRGLKQVKVDNWGSFFLQRLQQLYYEELFFDLKIKFPTSDITVQV